ncbi:hypothetical protein LOD99_11624 [Oopsacas minuta]|uniref:G-protein coupled receptors family 1 profile domain-containing protein n=1 Tax=Oopsacas minuta TaxID=111878 RepID=A0AAV7JKD6_9METZ|nr:hypothetical protein LOD99_11624 [Oopsacas minuta]
MQMIAGPMVILISLIWLSYFIKQAKNNYKQWRVNIYEGHEGLKRKVFFHKSALISTLLIADMIMCVASFAESATYLISSSNLTIDLKTENCKIRNETWLASIVFEREHSSSYFEGIWQSAVLAEFCIFISILRYFTCIYTQSLASYKKKRDYSLKKEKMTFLVIMVPQTLLLLCFDTSPDMIMTGQLIFGILALIYWWLTLKYAMELYKKLKWYQADMKDELDTIQKNNDVYNFKLYKSAIIILLLVSFLFIFAEFAYIVCNVWIGTIVLNNCWFIRHFPIETKISISHEAENYYRYVTFTCIILRDMTAIVFLISVLVLNAYFVVTEHVRRRRLDKFIRMRLCTENLKKPLLA